MAATARMIIVVIIVRISTEDCRCYHDHESKEEPGDHEMYQKHGYATSKDTDHFTGIASG